MKTHKRALSLLFVAATVMMSSYASAANNEVCFQDMKDYKEVRSKLPRLFHSLPITLTLGGFGNAGVKVMEDNGKIRIQSAVWSPMALTYGDEKVHTACFDGNKVMTLKMWDGSTFVATMKSVKKVHIQTPSGGGEFIQDTNANYVAKINYINTGALKKGIKPAFAAE